MGRQFSSSRFSSSRSGLNTSQLKTSQSGIVKHFSGARTPLRAVASLSLGVAIVLLSACSTTAPSVPNVPEATATVANGDDAAAPGAAAQNGAVTLVTTNSFAISDELIAEFEAETGLTLTVLPIGSAGELANQLVLTREHPLGDVFFGVDNTFASRLFDNNVVAEYTLGNLSANAANYVMVGPGEGNLIPITQGDVCLNIDLEWFEAHPEIPAPEQLSDLLRPDLAGQTVVLSPATSSPGLAFLLATIAEFGDGWPQYWEQLLDNDVLIVESWSQGYFNDFSGAGEGGTRPIVVSYSSSPASTLNAEGTASTTASLPHTCFRQVEYAGILAGAANPAGAAQVIKFLSGPQFQQELPTQMWVFPIDTTVELPAEWAQFTSQTPNPLFVSAEDIEANREQWLEQWRDLILQ